MDFSRYSGDELGHDGDWAHYRVGTRMGYILHPGAKGCGVFYIILIRSIKSGLKVEGAEISPRTKLIVS